GEPAATTRRIGRRDGAIRSGSSCPKVKHVLIEGQLARRCCCNVRQSSCLELRRRNAYLGVGGQDHSQTFCVDEEEGFVFYDRSTKRRAPLVSIVKRTRRAALIVEVVVGIQEPAIPEILHVAVPVVGAGLGDIVHLRARQSAILSGVAVADDGGLLHVILTEQKVGGSGVVQVEE